MNIKKWENKDHRDNGHQERLLVYYVEVAQDIAHPPS